MLEEELLEARLIKRYKRFLADVEMEGETTPLTIHCPNPGSMLGVAFPGARIWLRPARHAEAKLKYGWVLTELDTGILVCVDTLMANKLFADALKSQTIRELRGYEQVQKERQFQKSRFDFFLQKHKTLADCYVEVKSTTFAENKTALFPDAKTERGKKHLNDLIACKNSGLRAVQFYCISRTDTKKFSPASMIDSLYAERLREAAAMGVEVIAYSTQISRYGTLFKFEISDRVPVELT